MPKQRTEDALRDSQRLRLIMQQMPGLIWTVDCGLRFTSSAGAGLSSLGLMPGQVVGKTLHEYFETDDPEFPPIASHRRALSGEKTSFEFSWAERTFQVHVEPFHDPDGEVTGALGLAFDVSEEKRAVEALRESEKRYRKLFESSRDAIYVSTLDGRLVDFNEAMLGLFGYSRQEMRSLRAEYLYADPVDRRRFQTAIEKRGSVRDYELKLVAKDGTVMDCLLSSTAQSGDDGKVTGYQGIIRNITNRKLAEDILLREKAFSDAAIGSLPGLFYLFDDEGRFLRWNRNIEHVSGYSSDQIAKMSPLQFFRGDDRRAMQETIEKVLTWGYGSVEADFVGRDGTRTPYLFTGKLITLDGKRCIVGTGIDLVERRQLELQLHQSQKMEAIGQLAGGVAHDFNNVLTVILSNAELLLRGLGPEDPRRAELSDIREAAQRAASLTRQLLAFSRKQVLKPRVLNLNDVVSSIEKMLGRLIGEDIELVTMLDSELWSIEADPGQIEQIIMNLAVNARDAMPEGGRLSIETGNLEIDERFARAHYPITPGHYAMLVVCDTGEGMDAETRSRIFEPFFTTKQMGKGTGLGLSTVYGIVKQSGGFIWAYSEPGLGTTFKIYFPQVVQAAAAFERREGVSALEHAAETVLLVEDEASVRSLARRILREEGYVVLEAQSAVEALKVSLAHAGPIQLLLTDLVMPELNGRDLAEKLAARREDMRILFMSGYTDHAVFRDGDKQLDDNFLQKPFTPESLVRKVREVLDAPVEAVESHENN
ncbi:MAG TPA: PAS domain S-box protein [Gemmatimonadota bacterium]|nr:PAS domain S-box protein [Gemmatimonadota bacterium]